MYNTSSAANKWIPTKRVVTKWRQREEAEHSGEICKICNNELTDARTMPCLHSFCEQCLLLLLQTYEARGKLVRTFPCPICKFRIPCHVIGDVTDEWLELYPRKSLIDSLREAVDVIEEKCQACLNGEAPSTAAWLCVDCRQYMCVACQKDHMAQAKPKPHKFVQYAVKEMKATPISNISKFQCTLHSSLRYTGYCTVHNLFVCNMCKQSPTHRNCPSSYNILEATSTITKAETMMNDVNSLNRDEWNRGRQLFQLIQQVVRIQARLRNFRRQQEARYRNYVRQVTVTQQKCEEIDALKGKLEFVKTHMGPEVTYTTMRQVESILAEYALAFPEDDQSERSRVQKCLIDIEKALSQNIFDTRPEHVLKKTTFVVPREDHVCKRHVDYIMDEESLLRVAGLMKGVGSLCYNNMAATAFRVGSKFVLTTAHTVRDIVDLDRSGNSDWSALAHRGVFLTFDSQPNTGGPTYPISHQVPFLDDHLDIAVLEIDSDLPLPPPLVLSTKHVDALQVNHVTVLGYGQSGSNKKHVDFKCQLIRSDSERAKQAETWLRREERKYRCQLTVKGGDVTLVNWNYKELHDPARVAVDCCLGYRGMGSPLVAHLDSSRSEVVGIIIREIPDCYTDLPSETQQQNPEHRFELATTLNCLFDAVFVRDRHLAEDIFIMDKNYFRSADSEQEGDGSGTPAAGNDGDCSSKFDFAPDK